MAVTKDDIVIKTMSYANAQENIDFIELLDHYAKDIMGGGEPLAENVKSGLIGSMKARSHAISLLAYKDGTAVGLLNAFEGFSTFANKPLINIHDIIVREGYRACGIGQYLLKAIEQIAVTRGCCKLTLEVLSGNELAKNSYQKFGFTGYSLDESIGHALFWEKKVALS